MSNLSEALARYYSRDGRKFRFKNNQSLNQLALAMWERLGCQQIDASVLSRVLKGERLFTTQQLKIFCQLLALSAKEVAFLSSCLQEDYQARFSLPVDMPRISFSLAEEIIEELTTDTFTLFYQGQYDALAKRSDLVQQMANAYALRQQPAKAIDEAIGLNLYIKGRTIANGELPGRVIGKVLPVFHRLVAMSRSSRSQLLYGYAHVLLSTTYYLAGGYSDASAKHKFYATSIRLAKTAIDNLPEDDHERLFALRSIATSAGYTHDHDAIAYVLRKTKEAIPRQPKDNYINTLHLTMSLSKSLAANHMPQPFAVRDYAVDYFKRDLAGTGVYEVSGIKEEIDALRYLQTQDKTYLEQRIQAGLRLATEYNFQRQKRYFSKLLRQL